MMGLRYNHPFSLSVKSLFTWFKSCTPRSIDVKFASAQELREGKEYICMKNMAIYKWLSWKHSVLSLLNFIVCRKHEKSGRRVPIASRSLRHITLLTVWLFNSNLSWMWQTHPAAAFIWLDETYTYTYKHICGFPVMQTRCYGLSFFRTFHHAQWQRASFKLLVKRPQGREISMPYYLNRHISKVSPLDRNGCSFSGGQQ